jgi:hypothetical protein
MLKIILFGDWRGWIAITAASAATVALYEWKLKLIFDIVRERRPFTC